MQLSEQCKQYACDLLSQCRSTEEVIAILNKEDNINDENIDVWATKLSLSRLKRAIKYEQKTVYKNFFINYILLIKLLVCFTSTLSTIAYINLV